MDATDRPAPAPSQGGSPNRFAWAIMLLAIVTALICIVLVNLSGPVQDEPKLVDLIPSEGPSAKEQMVGMHRNDGRLEDAMKAAREVASVKATEVRGKVLVALVLADMNRDNEMAEELLKAVKLDPELKGAALPLETARKVLARYDLLKGKPQEALDRLKPFGAINPAEKKADLEVEWLRSRAFLQQGKIDAYQASSKIAKAFIDADPTRPEPSPYVGEAACTKCHAQIAKDHAGSRHAQTIFRAKDLEKFELPKGTIKDSSGSKLTHSFKRDDKGRIVQETKYGDETLTAFVDFALGSGHRGMTFVLNTEGGRVIESRTSKFPTEPHWDRTAGHPPVIYSSSGALGLDIEPLRMRRCIACHATDVEAFRTQQGPLANDRAIGCERCHGPGKHHVMAAEAKLPEMAIAAPKKAGAVQILNLCGQCHDSQDATLRRTRSALVDLGRGPDPLGNLIEGPRDVRFQVTALRDSRCFTQSQGALDCITCHEPHKNAETSASYYEAKCLECHNPTVKGNVDCPVNAKTDCLNCHMTKDSKSVNRSTFTDHHIKVKEIRRIRPTREAGGVDLINSLPSDKGAR